MNGFLQQVSTEAIATQGLPRHRLPLGSDVVIGREPGCQILLDSGLYNSVSRRHAVIQPLGQDSVAPGAAAWQICDLNSANGTYVNEQRLQGCRRLQPGDRIACGQNGPIFIFEVDPSPGSGSNGYATPETAAARAASYQAPDSAITLSHLIPILSTRKDLAQKAYLIPGILTVLFVVLMFILRGSPQAFNLILALYIGGAAYYFIYQLCGKRKPWWLLVGCALTTMVLLASPVLLLFFIVFRGILPGDVDSAGPGFLSQLLAHFFGAGLLEELLKALPVLMVYWWGRQLKPPQRDRLGVSEPLDGILLGAASALGFTLFETLGQYVPGVIQTTGMGLGELAGIQLLIPRILGSVAGHMAYSGYLGYFIGLSILKPAKRWQILGIGYLSASGLHAFWNASASLPYIGVIMLALVGVTSYAFLVSAILKARQLSPTRSQNFATRIKLP